MNVRPMIGAWEVPRIERIRAREDRRLSVLHVPGLDGDLHQDLGKSAMTVEIEGSLFGDEARDEFLSALREPFLAGEPVDFVADIIHESELEQVLVRALDVEEVADSPDAFRYRIVLAEYTEPPEPPGLDMGFGVDLDAGLDLGLDVDLGLDLLDLPGIVADVPDVGDLLSPVEGAAEELKGELEKAGDVLSPLKDLLQD